MLILSRKINERIVVGNSLVITVTGIQGDLVRLGFEGPADLPIHREEIHRRLNAEMATNRYRPRSARKVLRMKSTSAWGS